MANYAYKVSSDVLRSIIEAPMPTPPEDYDPESGIRYPTGDLIGLQFEFRKKTLEGTTLEGNTFIESFAPPYLFITRVYFDVTQIETDGENAFSVWPARNLDDDGPGKAFYLNGFSNTIGFGDNQIFPIIAVESEEGDNFQLGNEPLGLYHNFADFPNSIIHYSLDFFDEKTAFVYFNIEQISPLITYFSHLIISGATIRFGKRLATFTNEDSENWQYTESAFSIKIEGEGPLTNASLQSDEVTAPNMAMGMPCPPDWYNFQGILEFLQRSYEIPESAINLLRQDWTQNVYVGSLPASNYDGPNL